jgi:hypothetical protein
MSLNNIKVCVHESFSFFEGENECETERFNSEIWWHDKRGEK